MSIFIEINVKLTVQYLFDQEPCCSLVVVVVWGKGSGEVGAISWGGCLLDFSPNSF